MNPPNISYLACLFLKLPAHLSVPRYLCLETKVFSFFCLPSSGFNGSVSEYSQLNEINNAGFKTQCYTVHAACVGFYVFSGHI